MKPENCPMHHFRYYGEEAASNDFIHKICDYCGRTEYLTGDNMLNPVWVEVSKLR